MKQVLSSEMDKFAEVSCRDAHKQLAHVSRHIPIFFLLKISAKKLRYNGI